MSTSEVLIPLQNNRSHYYSEGMSSNYTNQQPNPGDQLVQCSVPMESLQNSLPFEAELADLLADLDDHNDQAMIQYHPVEVDPLQQQLMDSSRTSFDSLDSSINNDSSSYQIINKTDSSIVSSSETMSVISENSDAMEEYKNHPKKRQKYNNHNNPFKKTTTVMKLPKILRNDIRRNYANMWANVINSADEEMTRSFFMKFTHPNFSFYYVVKDLLQNISDQKVLNSRSNTFKFFMIKFLMLPDLFARILDVKLKTSSEWNGKSELFAAIHATGTQLYNIPEETWLTNPLKPNKRNDTKEFDIIFPMENKKDSYRRTEVEKHRRMLLGKKRKLIHSISTSKSISDEIPDFEDKFQSLQINPKLLSNPIFMQCNSTIRFSLDENKMIERIEMHSTMPIPTTT